MKSLFYIVPLAAVAGVWFFFRDPQTPAPIEQRAGTFVAARPAGREIVSEESGAEAGAIRLTAVAPDQEIKPPFLVKVYVRRIFTGWQRLEFAEDKLHRSGLRGDLVRDVDAIKARLYSDGFFTETALRKHMLQAAEELGYRPEEARHVVNKVLAVVRAEEAAKNPQEQYRHRAPAGLPFGL